MDAPTAPAGSPAVALRGSGSFLEDMAWRGIRLLIPHKKEEEGVISELVRRDDQHLTVIKIRTRAGAISGDERLRLETTGGLGFVGTVVLAVTDGLQSVATIHVKEDDVCSCSPCTEVGMPTPLSETTLGTTVRFSGLDPHRAEATVVKVERRESASLTIVHLQMAFLPPYLSTGDTIILQSLDALNHWEGDIRYYADSNFFEDCKAQSLDSSTGTIVINVRDKQVLLGPKLLRPILMHITVKRPPPPPCHIKFQWGTCKKSPNERKIKVGINGYKGIGMALARVALQSPDVELVAFNDPFLIDQMTFGGKKVHIFKSSEHDTVPWYETGAEFIVETARCSQSAANYKNYASNSDVRNIINLLAPLDKIIGDRFGSCVFSPTTQNYRRAPLLQIFPVKPSDAKAISEIFPDWKGEKIVKIVHVPAVDMLDVTCELMEYDLYRVMLSNTKPNVDFPKLIGWCFDMIRQIPDIWWCEVVMSIADRR